MSARSAVQTGETQSVVELLAHRTVNLFGAQGHGFAAVSGDPTGRRHTGSLSGDLVFDITRITAGRKLLSIDALVTIVAAGTASTGTFTCVSKANTVNDDHFVLPKAILVLGVPTDIVIFYDVDGGSVTPVDTTHIKVDISGATTDVTVALATRLAIEAVPGILYSVSSTSSATRTVTRTSVGSTYNGQALTETVANAGFTTTPLTGGVDATLATFACTIETVDFGDVTPRTVVASATVEAGFDVSATDKTLSFTPAAHTIDPAKTTLLVFTPTMRKTSDSVTIKGIKLQLAA
jgi:hypothetical protein